jgi:hypothetical protein
MRYLGALVAVAVAGCGGGGGDPGGADASPGGDVAAGPDASTVTYPKPCGDVYDQDLVPIFALTIPQAEWDALADQQFHPLTEFRYGAEVVTNARIRIEGAASPKVESIIISFTEVDPAARFHGLRELFLDAPPSDASFLKSRLALAYLRELGLPASCANSARLNVNGAYYGLYTSIERVDEELLRRVFPDGEAGGALYLRGQGAGLAQWSTTTDYAGMSALADLPEVAAEWAAEAVIPQVDGYFAGSDKFYIYDHPTRGLMFVPWDLDLSFDSAPVDADPISYRAPWGGPTPHFDGLLADPAGAALYRNGLVQAIAAYQPGVMEEQVDRWRVQIVDAAFDDVNKPFSFGQHLSALNALRGYLRPRAEYLMCSAVGADADGDGWSMCDDCDDSNPAINPGATEICDGIDQDCTGIPDDTDLCPDCAEMPFGVVRFMFCTRPRTWDNSLTNCINKGGTLATPLDMPQNDYVGATDGSLGVNDEWWIGANDRTTEDVWTDPIGVVLSYLPWNPGSPNGGTAENCGISVASFGGLWKDRACSELRPSVCRLP